MSKDEPLLSNCPLETAEPSRNYARVAGYKKKYKKKTRKRREKRDVLQNENCNFRKGPGTRCEKNGACSRISTRKFVWTAFFANKIFVSRSYFREVNPVVQLVQSGGSVGSSHSTGFASIFFLHRDSIDIWTSVMFSWSTFGLWWVACAEWLFEPVAAVDGNRFSSNLQWTWFCVCGLEEQRTNSFSSMSPSSWESSRRREKCENPPSQPNKKPPKQLTPNSANYEARLPNRLVRTSHTPAGRANDMINSPIEQKLQFSVCKTTRRFTGPSLFSCGLKPSFTKIWIRISFCKTSLRKEKWTA